MSEIIDRLTFLENQQGHLLFRVQMVEAAFSYATGFLIHETSDPATTVERLIDLLRDAMQLPPPTREQMSDPMIVEAWQTRMAYVDGLFQNLRGWALQKNRPTPKPGSGVH